MYLCQGVTRNYDMTVSLFRNSCYLEQLNARRSAESSSQFKVVLVIQKLPTTIHNIATGLIAS